MHKDISLALYKKIHQSMPIPCVDAVIAHEGKMLLCKRVNEPAKGKWWFVGGRVKKGETLEEAVVRKVKQEAGFDVKIVRQLGVEETIFETGPFGWSTHTVNVVYLVQPKGKVETLLDDQHEELAWFGSIKKDL